MATGWGKLDCRISSAFGVVGVNAFRYAVPSMNRTTVQEKPPSSRFALSAIASNTGCTSDGELAMTLRISDVAAWPANALSRSMELALSLFSSSVMSCLDSVIEPPIALQASVPTQHQRLD